MTATCPCGAAIDTAPESCSDAQGVRLDAYIRFEAWLKAHETCLVEHALREREKASTPPAGSAS